MMKFTKRKIFIISFFIILVLMVGTGTWILQYIKQTYPKEWKYWNETPGSVKLLSIELEFERILHRIIKPAPDPARYAHVTADLLEKRMRLGADWILNMQEPSGRFQYWYDPVEHKFSSRYDDNFLRQAGTSFSLMLVYEMTGDTRYIVSARRNIEYLLQYKKDLESDKAYFLFGAKAKLGGISLPMLTMLKLRGLTGTNEYDDILKKLANMIIYLQAHYQTGQYKSTYVYHGDYEHEKTSGWESRIYPGEALYALACMYRTFGDPKYKHSMDYALEFYSRKTVWKHHAFLSWTISAFVTLYEQTPEEHYADYIFMLTDYLLTQQNLDSTDDVYGSFHGIPAANTGVYLEGLADAIYLAQLMKNTKREERYSEHARMGYLWLLTLQYTDRNQSDTAGPDTITGGFRKDISDSQLRIDNTQHAISAFAKGLHYVYGRSPAVTVQTRDNS